MGSKRKKYISYINRCESSNFKDVFDKNLFTTPYPNSIINKQILRYSFNSLTTQPILKNLDSKDKESWKQGTTKKVFFSVEIYSQRTYNNLFLKKYKNILVWNLIYMRINPPRPSLQSNLNTWLKYFKNLGDAQL